MRLPVLTLSRPAPARFETGPRSISAVKMLRISVTDRCNLRCVYCMPTEGMQWLPGDDLMSFEEIEHVVRAAVEVHGIRRFKLTGGEPTVRPGIIELISRLRRITGVHELSMTTNGLMLSQLARPLQDAGLDRLTVSIDSLDPVRFRRITRNGDLSLVLDGLDACEDVGFKGLKINVVVMRSINDDEAAAFARLSLTRSLTVRFIEYMPLGEAALLQGEIDPSETGPAAGCGARDLGQSAFVSELEVRQRIESELGPLVPVDRRLESGVGPSVIHRLRDGNPRGRIGFISAMSAPFCSTCNRLRLTANGVLRSCLFDGGEVSVRRILRESRYAHDRQEALASAMRRCVQFKPEIHSGHGSGQMSQIGG